MEKDHSLRRNVFFESPLLMRTEAKSLHVSISWTATADLKSFASAICIVNDIASNILELIRGNDKCMDAGKVYLTADEVKHKVGNLYTFNKVLFVVNTSPIPAECCFDWTKIVLGHITQCIVFDAVARKTIPSQHDSLLRSIATSCATTSTIPSLEIGAVVGSLTASIVTHCEINDVPCVAFIALREAQYTTEAAKTLEILLPRLQELFDDSTLQFPSVEFYKNKRRQDVFIFNTENMYT